MKQNSEKDERKNIELFTIDEVLPMSTGGKQRKFAFNSTKFVPSLLTSLSGTLFMCYLLTRRHELTPDFFHFITCI